MTNVLGVAGWLLAWATSVGVEPELAGVSSESGAAVEGEVWFPEAVGLTVPAQLPAPDGASERFALLVWSVGGGAERACAYEMAGDHYALASCDGDLSAGSTVGADYVAVWSDVEQARQGTGGRIFIDFTGGGVVLGCNGSTYYLGDVDPASVDVEGYCGG